MPRPLSLRFVERQGGDFSGEPRYSRPCLLQRFSCRKTIFRRALQVVPRCTSLVGAEHAKSRHAPLERNSGQLILRDHPVRICPTAGDRELIPVLRTGSEQEFVWLVRIAGRRGWLELGQLTGEIDFLIAQIVPEDCWYVIPLKAILPRKSLRIYPEKDPRKGPYGKYREAWHLIE